jgi:predicted MFS family arabinose efflux permease
LFTFGNILTITSSSLPVLLLSRAVAGMGAGIFSPLASSTAANMVDVPQKGRALSSVLDGLGSGTAFGIPVGLAIERWFGWRWTIGLLVLLGLIAAAGVALYRAELPKMRTVDWKARLSALKAPFTLATLSVTFFTSFSVRGLYTYIAVLRSNMHS